MDVSVNDNNLAVKGKGQEQGHGDSATISITKGSLSNGFFSHKEEISLQDGQASEGLLLEKGVSLSVICPEKSSGDWAFQDAERFQESFVSRITTIEEAKLLLVRTRAVTTMSNRLMLVPDERSCYEEASKLLVGLFKIERSSYALMSDDSHFSLLSCSVSHEDYSKELAVEFRVPGSGVPVAGTAIEECSRTLAMVYAPNTKVSPYKDHQKMNSMGLGTVLNVPILVEGGKFAGCLNLGTKQTDSLTLYDRILIGDIAASLGVHVFAKRLHASQQEAHRVSQELLHSIIHPRIIDKIQHYWKSEMQGNEWVEVGISRSSSNDCNAEDGSKPQNETRFQDIKQRLEGLQSLGGDSRPSNFIGTTAPLIEPKQSNQEKRRSKALFAEEREGVSIIFTDIVGFSALSLVLPPMEVMDMLTDMFERFDRLTAQHGMVKLETVGDAYVCCAGLFDDDEQGFARSAAVRALDMARDMVSEARNVHVQGRHLEIRAGIHIGEITYGVLGQNLPKLSLFGSTMNKAARMEQTAPNGQVQVSSEFYKALGDKQGDYSWEETRLVSIKNMGNVKTWVVSSDVEF